MRESSNSLKSTRKIALAMMLALTLMGIASVQNAEATTFRSNRIAVLIGFKGPIESRIITRVGGIVTSEFPMIQGVAADVPEAAIPVLKRNPKIDFVELDREVHALGETLPWGIERVNATAVWDTDGDLEVDPDAICGSDIKVAVIDTGILYTHPDLAERYRRGYDFVNDDRDPLDDNGHGTHVAGTIGATDNDLGVIGAAPNVTLYSLKVLNATGWGVTSDVVSAILWAIVNRMDIVSMSLGSPIPSLLEMKACDAAYNAGILLVASTGNEGYWWSGFPAGYGSVIGVGAINEDNTLADFSNKGLGLELVAPGVNVNSTFIFIDKVIVDSTELDANVMEYSPLTSETGITAQVLYGGLGYPEDFVGQDFTGKLALIQRGEITFGEKVANAYAAGAVGAIIYNNEPGNFLGTLGSPGAIPAVSLSQEDGVYLRGLIEAGPTTATLIACYSASYASFEGTSMATPHVSGVAALVMDANPALTAAEVRAILQETAIDLGKEGKDMIYGYGLVDAYAAVQAALAVSGQESD